MVHRLRDIDSEPRTEEDVQETIQQIIEMENVVFGGWLRDEDPGEALRAIAEFSRGYPSAPVRPRQKDPVFSWEYDLNEIIIAIRNQSGIDLSYRRKEPFHWWEFLLEFRTLCGEHYILNLMEIRGYSGKDPEMKRRKQEFALPPEYTAKEKKENEAFLNMFRGEENSNED